MRRERQLSCVLLALTVLAFSLFPVLKSEAGVNVTVLDGSSLTSSMWSNPEEDVLIENETIVFPESSTEYSRFISKMAAKKDDKFSVLTSMSASLEFSKLPKGQSFILAFGLGGIESLPGDAGNVEVTFTNNGNLQMGITVFDEQNNAVVVAEPKNCGVSANSKVNVKAEIDTAKMIKVYVNGKMACSGTLPNTGEGRIGFLQTGGCEVRISNLSLNFYQYDRPENTDVSEDFEKGVLDVSKLTAKGIMVSECYPSGQIIEEYNGSQVLKFHNVWAAYVGTVYPYSNFELTFDVPYIQTVPELNEDGSLKEENQSDFIVAFGSEASDFDSPIGWQSAAESLIFDQASVYSYNHPEEYNGKLTRSPFTENRPITVKVTVVDGHVTVEVKWTDEEQFQTILGYELKSGMPTGYVQIWIRDRGNFAIDNMKVKNLDEEPNVIETEFRSGSFTKPEDVSYEAMNRVYENMDQDKEKRAEKYWYLLIPATAVAGVAALSICMFVSKKAKKGVAANEE